MYKGVYNGNLNRYDDDYITQILCLLLKSKGIPTSVRSAYFLRFVAQKPWGNFHISLG